MTDSTVFQLFYSLFTTVAFVGEWPLAFTIPHECTTQSDRPCLGVCLMHSAV